MTKTQTVAHTLLFYIVPICWLWYNSLQGADVTMEQTIINAAVVLGGAILGLIGTIIATSYKTGKKIDSLKSSIQNYESHVSRDHNDMFAQTGVTSDTKSLSSQHKDLSSQHSDIKNLLNAVGRIIESERNTRQNREEILGNQDVNIKAVLDGVSALNQKLVVLEKEKLQLLSKVAKLEDRLSNLEMSQEDEKER